MKQELLRDIYMKIRHINDAAIKNFITATEGYEATGVQFGVLRNIPRQGEISMSELTERVRCVASNMTTIIRRMEKQGLVVTQKNAADRRQTMVILTDKGAATRTLMEKNYQEFLTGAFGALTISEQEQLYQLLSKIEKNLIPG